MCARVRVFLKEEAGWSRRCGLVRVGAGWCGLVRVGVGWCGLVRVGVGWCGLVLSGFCTPPSSALVLNSSPLPSPPRGCDTMQCGAVLIIEQDGQRCNSWRPHLLSHLDCPRLLYVHACMRARVSPSIPPFALSLCVSHSGSPGLTLRCAPMQRTWARLHTMSSCTSSIRRSFRCVMVAIRHGCERV